jgi:hypothetical protein
MAQGRLVRRVVTGSRNRARTQADWLVAGGGTGRLRPDLDLLQPSWTSISRRYHHPAATIVEGADRRMRSAWMRSLGRRRLAQGKKCALLKILRASVGPGLSRVSPATRGLCANGKSWQGRRMTVVEQPAGSDNRRSLPAVGPVHPARTGDSSDGSRGPSDSFG